MMSEVEKVSAIDGDNNYDEDATTERTWMVTTTNTSPNNDHDDDATTMVR